MDKENQEGSSNRSSNFKRKPLESITNIQQVSLNGAIRKVPISTPKKPRVVKTKSTVSHKLPLKEKSEDFAEQYEHDYMKIQARGEFCLYKCLDPALAQHRLIIVNWLFRITDKFLCTKKSTIFTAVAMLDQVVDLLYLRWNELQVAAFAILRILQKLDNLKINKNRVPLSESLPKTHWKDLAHSCGLSMPIINEMEGRVLTNSGFKLLFPEPSLFAQYYIKCLKLESKYAPLVRHFTFYLLENFLLCETNHMHLPSEKAACAVFMGLKLYPQLRSRWLQLKSSEVVLYYNPEAFIYLEEKMFQTANEYYNTEITTALKYLQVGPNLSKENKTLISTLMESLRTKYSMRC